MPTADGPAMPPPRWAADSRDLEVSEARERRLELLRESQWIYREARNGERAEVLDAAFDDLEVRR